MSDRVFPGSDWESSEPDDGVDSSRLDAALDAMFGTGDATPPGVSLATIVVHRGRIVRERYGHQPDTVFGPGGPVDRDTTLISWSMAKSVTHALVGMLVEEGRLDLDAPVAVDEWRDTSRASITLRDLLRMRDGLAFVEDYVLDESGNVQSDVIAMLFGEGSNDVAGYARSRPLAHEPGSTWSYSSGTTNIICSLLRDLIGTHEAIRDFIDDRLFRPLGMSSATARLDDAGTFIGSSYVYATARDFARFGYLYLCDGLWNDRRILSSSWIATTNDVHAVDPENGHGYSWHWWSWNADPRVVAALGYEGQRTIVDRDRDLVVVHLGKWVADTQPTLDRHLTDVLESFPHA